MKKLEAISILNRYFVIHQNIITRGLTRASSKNEAKNLLGYVEGHHIVPISFSMGGEDDMSNLVFLTAKEHIMVHRLMCKFLENEYRIHALRAFHCMCYKNNGGRNKRNPSIHHLAKSRMAASEANKGDRGIQGVPAWFTETDNLDEFKKKLQHMVDSNMSDPKIGEIYNVTATTIHNWRRKLKIGRRRPELRDREWLYTQYVVNRLSTGEMAELIGCTGAAVLQYLYHCGIERRSSLECQRLRQSKERSNEG